MGVDADDLGIHISTLHSLAFKIVKAYSDELGLSSHLEIIDLSPKPQSILSQVFVGDLFEYSKSIGLVVKKKDFDQLLRRLAEEWRQNKRPSGDYMKLEEVVSRFCDRYSALSWDQLALLAITAISENGLPKWLQGAQHFLIDEYQDFNPAEQRLLELITEPSDSVIIVGDPDQSIYSGRSASPEGLINLLSQDNVEYVNFVYCRRCPRKVLTAANNMLRFMDPAGFADKELQPFKDEDGDLVIASFISCKAEVEQIVKLLKTLDASEKSDTIILLPAKKAIDYYVNKLKVSGIDCKVRATDLSEEVLLAILRLVILPDHPFVIRIVLLHFQNIERKFRTKVLPMFIDGGDSLVETLKRAGEDKKWQKRLKETLSDFVSTAEQLISNNVDSIVAGLSELSYEVKREIIELLLASDDNLSARERVESALYSEETESDEDTEDTGIIEVMTMHSSKGLSKQLVIIPAFDEKLLPGENTGERLAETHRLVYVAVTRAKNQVLITFPKTRAKGDPLNYGARPKISSYANILVPPAGR